MILCVTPNPAVDRTLVVPKLIPGEVHRTTQTITAAGGKGLNAARVIRTLSGLDSNQRSGAEPVCLGFLGGSSGQLVAELADREGLRGAWTWIENETRTCIILVENEGGEPTVINDSGPGVSAVDWAALRARVIEESVTARWVCFSGSLPPGSPLESFEGLLAELTAARCEVWVDTSGQALAAAARIESINLKVNGVEAGVILGNTEIRSIEEARAAVNELCRWGAKMVVLTLGKWGAVLGTQAGCWVAQPPALQAISAVGSGDALLGGLVLALSQGRSPADALSWGVSAGSANALSVGGGQVTLDDFTRILKAVTGEPLL